jgi:hypothetical protein
MFVMIDAVQLETRPIEISGLQASRLLAAGPAHRVSSADPV